MRVNVLSVFFTVVFAVIIGMVWMMGADQRGDVRKYNYRTGQNSMLIAMHIVEGSGLRMRWVPDSLLYRIADSVIVECEREVASK